MKEEGRPVPACRVLLVEDDAGMQDLLLDELTEGGYAVVAASTIAHAVEQLAASEFDIVLADQRLPDGQGSDLLPMLQSRHRPPAFVILTAFGSVADAVATLKLGADDFLTKPVDLEHLQARLAKLRDVQRLRSLLLRSEDQQRFHGIVGRSPAMRHMFDEIELVARATGPVLVVGESGVGKERIARALHERSSLRSGPFIAVNAAALPESLVDSELFGHTAGAFTGAQRERRGLFEEARGGTLLLDEVTELPLQLQAKLLRVLQESTVRRVGANREQAIDVRVVATTNRDPQRAVRDGDFRQDLYFRLETFLIRVPPLRERRDDIEHLVAHFLGVFCTETRKTIDGVSPEALHALREYDYPGNVRELENIVERAVAFCQGREIGLAHLPRRLVERAKLREAESRVLEQLVPDSQLPPLDSVKRRYIEYVLERTSGNKRRAAAVLGIGRRTLYRQLSPLDNEPANE